MNPEEQLRAGLAMLANPASANEWRQAIALLESAASAGFAEAIERRVIAKQRPQLVC